MHNVEPIKPKDDAFHGSKGLAAEWWYFDGVFSDGYSFHIGIRTFSRKKRGRAILIFELYKQDTIVFEKKKPYKFKDCQVSKNTPEVSINGKKIMQFDMTCYQEKNEWVYHITLSIDDCHADLYFTGITDGFKVETQKESWTVALPKATITGSISYQGKKLSVEGIGYHDHNWNYTLLSAITYGKGWYWGKIKGNKFNIVWANVLKRSGIQDLLAIVNVDNNGFFAVKPEKIMFQPKKYIRYRHRKIPSLFSFNFKDTVNETNISAQLFIEVTHIHYSKVVLASYWRYHVQITGSITVDENTETIDNVQIMEYLSMI